jgi:hypothetical protein
MELPNCSFPDYEFLLQKLLQKFIPVGMKGEIFANYIVIPNKSGGNFN